MKLAFQPNLNILTHLYSLARAAITKYHRSRFSHSSGGWKSETKAPSGMASSEASLLGWQPAAFLCVFSYDLGMGTHGITSFSYKESSHRGLRPTLMTAFNLNYLHKGPISTYSHIGEGAGMGFNVQILRRYNLVHSTMGKEMRN